MNGEAGRRADRELEARGAVREVTVDDEAVMKVADISVNLPEKVQVVDSRNGKMIGFRDRSEVATLLAEDFRFTGFEDTVTGEFMLSYNLDTTKAIESETVDPFEFLKTIEVNADTAFGVDDRSRLLFGVSYVDSRSRNRVLYINVRWMRSALGMLHQGIAEVLTDERGASSQRIVDFVLRKRSAKLQGGCGNA